MNALGYIVMKDQNTQVGIVLSEDAGIFRIRWSDSPEDTSPSLVSKDAVRIVFPIDIAAADLAQQEKRAGHKANTDPRMTNDLLNVGALLDLALAIEFVWDNGRLIYCLLDDLYHEIKSSNTSEHGQKSFIDPFQ